MRALPPHSDATSSGMTTGGATTASRRRQSMVKSLLFLLLISLLAPVTSANGKNGVTFLFPTGGEVFYYRDVVNVTYISPFDAPRLFIFCGTNGGSPRYIRTEFVAPLSAWALVQMNFTSSDSCWLNIRPNSSTRFGDNSDHFSILGAQREATTVGMATLMSSTTAKSSPGLTTEAATATADTTGTPAGDERDGSQQAVLGPGAIAGVCIGTAIVATIIGGAVVAACLARKRRTSQHLSRQGTSPGACRGALGFPEFLGGSGGWVVEKPREKIASITNTASDTRSASPRDRDRDRVGAGEGTGAGDFGVSVRSAGGHSTYSSSGCYTASGSDGGGSERLGASHLPGYNARLASFAVAQMSVPDFSNEVHYERAVLPGYYSNATEQGREDEKEKRAQTPVVVAHAASGADSLTDRRGTTPVELPSKYQCQAWGGEQELPAPILAPVQPTWPPRSADQLDQKCLLSDVAFLKENRAVTGSDGRRIYSSMDPGRAGRLTGNG